MSILNKKYPAPKASKNALIISLLFGLFIGCFLVFFQPFGLNLTNYENKNFKIFFYGIITSIVLIIFLILLPTLFPKVFSDKNWSVKNQIIFYLAILLVIATLNGLYINYLEGYTFNWLNYWWIIKRTIVLGGIPIFFIVLIDYNRRLKIYIKQVAKLNVNKNEEDSILRKTVFQIETGTKNKMFLVDENKFLFAEAQGNYVFVFQQTEKEQTKTLFRISLTHLEEQLDSHNLKRCHRSYLVNFLKVENITGNAQGLKLWVRDGEFKIPVSRKYLPTVRKYFPEK